MKRARPVNSCLSCRKRRVRCDKVRPTCGRCKIARIACSYDQSATADAVGDLPASTPVAPALSTGAPGPAFMPSLSGATPRPTIVPQHNPREKGHFVAEHGGRSSYIGSTFWANPIQTEYQTYNEENPDFPSRGGYSGDGHFLDWTSPRSKPAFDELRWPKVDPSRCRFCGDRYTLSCILSMLPDQYTCEKLCNLFCATVFPLIPLLHLPSFAEDFQSFWEEIDPSNRHNSEIGPFLRRKPGFVCLISSILFTTLASASPQRLRSVLGDDTSLAAGDMYFAAVISGRMTGFPRSPSIYTLAGYIYSQSQFVREEDYTDSQEFISTAFRIALGMGLHRYIPEAGFLLAEIEMRRRLWWYILHLDVMSSASSGLSPLFIDEKMANTEMISPYYQNESDPGQDIYTIDVRYLVAARRYEISKEIRNILRLHFEDALQTLDQVEEVAIKLKATSERVNQTVSELLAPDTSPSGTTTPLAPTSFSRIWRVDPNGNDLDVVTFCSWAALLLHLMIHKAYCTLYHPVFKDPLMASNISVRESAVGHAQAFVQLFIRVCDDPVSEPFHWMYPGTFQPLQAVSILLADLLQYPQSNEAPESRALVDAIFDLYNVNEGIVSQNNPPRRQLSPSGKAAWSILSRTRKKALSQVGQDHHTLFPSRRVFSDYCICGARISRGQFQGPDDPGSLNSPTDQDTIPDDQGIFMPGQIGLEDANFDWQEFESTLGMSMGMMS